MRLDFKIGENCKCGDRLSEILTDAGVALNMSCGGNGRCGKCAVRIVSGTVRITESDRDCFTAEQLENGMRLACTAIVCEDISVDIPEAVNENEIFVPSDGIIATDFNAMQESTGRIGRETNYGFAVDIGTTTIAVAAVNAATGEVFDTYTGINHQRAFGSDVISRIVASNNGYGPVMRDAVIGDINAGIDEIMRRNGLGIEQLGKIAIAGNTAMQHIFNGYSCEGLSMAPFEPVSLELAETASGVILPGISAFVGADILAGIYACGMAEKEANGGLTLFLDLGTNGEMALGNSDRILVASTAAGPAFEGGNISCGIASVPGAIYDIELSDEDDEEPITLHLIGEGSKEPTEIPIEPKGICGTGVIALAAELKRNGLIDENGLIDSRLGRKIKLTESGSVTFTQKDMRELQLAKAAVRAGIETLLFTFGATCDDIDRLCIAGSFGTMLDVKKASEIGLIPPELAEVAETVGNAALNGAVQYLKNPSEASKELEAIKKKCTEIELAGNDYFASQFILNM